MPNNTYVSWGKPSLNGKNLCAWRPTHPQYQMLLCLKTNPTSMLSALVPRANSSSLLNAFVPGAHSYLKAFGSRGKAYLSAKHLSCIGSSFQLPALMTLLGLLRLKPYLNIQNLYTLRQTLFQS